MPPRHPPLQKRPSPPQAGTVRGLAWRGRRRLRAQLPAAVAADSRLVDCAVRRFTEGMWRRELEVDDFTLLQDLETDFVAGDLRISSLLIAITETEEYQAAEHLEGAEPHQIERVANARILSPSQLASSVEQLTGYTWWYEGYAQLDNDTWGYRVLAGGANPPYVNEISADHTITRDLVIKRLAQAAGVADDKLRSREDIQRLDDPHTRLRRSGTGR